jgi:hypothetical protein
MPFILAHTAFETGLDNAIIQESVILYMPGSYRDIPPKNGCDWWVAFL